MSEVHYGSTRMFDTDRPGYPLRRVCITMIKRKFQRITLGLVRNFRYPRKCDLFPGILKCVIMMSKLTHGIMIH